MSNSQPLDIHSLLDDFESTLDSKSPSTGANYLKALNSFRTFLRNSPHIPGDPFELIAPYLLHLFLTSTTRATANHYLSILLSAIKPDRAVRTALTDRLNQIYTNPIPPSALPRLLSLLNSPRDYSLLIIHCSLFAGLDPVKVALLRRDDIDTLPDEIATLLRSHIDPRRKYILPLSQSRYTPRQLCLHVEATCLSALRTAGIPTLATLAATLATYRSYLSQMPVVRESSAWFAMRLRPGVRFERISEAIEAAPVPSPELYYPVREITAKEGRRVKVSWRPVVPGVVFFCYPRSAIPALFHHIGDKAWCYCNATGYAPIPDASMRVFKNAVSRLTSEYEVAPVGTLSLAPGERVVVVGGLFSGLEAEILDSSLTETGVVYRLTIFGDSNDIEWRVADPSLLLKKK